MERDVHKEVSRVCAPLFLESKFLRNGHTDKTTSATITFVKFKGILYFVTCRHVVDAIKHLDAREADAVPRINFGRASLDIAGMYVSPDDMNNPIFCPDFSIHENIDIAVKAIDMDCFKALSKLKDKHYIDLDNYKLPHAEKINFLTVFGWLDEHKEETAEIVSTPMVGANVEVCSPFDPEQNIFRLYSELDEPHNLFFSGVSGGPVYFCDDESDEIYPVGIVFGGSPGSQKSLSPDNIISSKDIYFECFYLTPSIFERWVREAKPIHNVDPSYSGFMPVQQALESIRKKESR